MSDKKPVAPTGAGKADPPPGNEVADGETSATPAKARWTPNARRRSVTLLIALVALAALLTIFYAWRLPPFGAGIERTENAYVRGRTTSIAPQVSGYVVEVLVKDYERVEKGEVIARIDDRIYRARVAQARANLDAQLAGLANSRQARASRGAALQSQGAGARSAEAQLAKAQADMRRVEDLVSDGSVSMRERDQTRAALALAEANLRHSRSAVDIARQDVTTVDVGRGGLAAQVEAAQAQLRLAEIDLENTVIRAPEAGQVSEVGVRLGQYVTNGTLLVSLVPDERWVIANFKEAQTVNILPGQAADIRVDALGGAELTGTVERLAPAAGSEFAVLKPDNATGNFVKVPQRLGVRIRIDPGQRLAARIRPGMSVTAEVDTRSKPRDA